MVPADPTVNAAIAAVKANRPVATAQPATAPYAAVAAAKSKSDTPDTADDVQKLRGPAARVVVNMEASLEVPTATSVRAVPAKLMVDNRIVINNHLARGRGGKISFTHLIGYALVEALGEMPAMNASYTQLDGKPAVNNPAHVNFGLAIDLAKPDGTRQLLVPSVKKAEQMDFAQFWAAYETWSAGPAATSSRSTTSPARRSRSPTRAASAPCTRSLASCRARARSSASAPWTTPRSSRAPRSSSSPAWVSRRS